MTNFLHVIQILFDPGGVIAEYEHLARVALATRTEIQIVGDCYSACTILADQARSNVCITPTTRFHIHQGTEHPSGRRFPVIYTADIAPIFSPQPTEGWLTLTYPTLRNYWRTCQ